MSDKTADPASRKPGQDLEQAYRRALMAGDVEEIERLDQRQVPAADRKKAAGEA